MDGNRTYRIEPPFDTLPFFSDGVPSMYVHPAFQIDHGEALAMLRERAFGTLVVTDTAGRPVAAHLPFLVHETTDRGFRVELHVARANPMHDIIAADGQPALLICQGPDAYISPDWYGAANQVPTWTYTAVHLDGVLTVVPEVDGWAHVDRLSDEFERRLLPKPPWTADKMDPQRRSAMMKAIVTMDLAVPASGVQAQKKLIQHKGAVEHRGAIAGLRARGDSASADIAAMMERNLIDKLAQA